MVIIGGGITGAGIVRDLTMRGIGAILVEKKDLAAGATGRCHGLLHSGARYVVKDPESAKECITENKILKRIASRSIEDTGGLFVGLPGDDEGYIEKFLNGCNTAGIEAHEMTLSKAKRIEPNLTEEARTIIKVPDGAVDPFDLTVDNAEDASMRGATILTHTEAIGFIIEKGRVVGVTIRDRVREETGRIRAKYVVNASGAWAEGVAELSGTKVPLSLSKGTLLVFNRRINNNVINRLRPPGDGDIIVPNEPTSIIGTTSITVNDPEHFTVTQKEVEMMMRQAALVLPPSIEARVIRGYAGIRPLYAPEGGSGRGVSRDFIVIDHEKTDGLSGLISIVGGKLTIYRLMAERVVDIIAQNLGVNAPCQTAEVPIHGSEDGEYYNLGKRFDEIEIHSDDGEVGVEEVVCECELITKREIVKVIRETKSNNLNDIRHRTRVGMGSCQGGFCTYRLLGILHEMNMVPYYEANDIMINFMEERWRGIRPVLWGEQLREEQLVEGIYLGIFALDKVKPVVGKKREKYL